MVKRGVGGREAEVGGQGFGAMRPRRGDALQACVRIGLLARVCEQAIALLRPLQLPVAQRVGGIATHVVEFLVQPRLGIRSEEHTSELQSLMRISYAVFCLKKKKKNNIK